MATVIRLDAALRRALGNCPTCGGWLELGRDILYRVQATCINCGRERIKYPVDKTSVDEAATIEASLRKKATRGA